MIHDVLAKVQTEPLSEGQRKALITLLVDEDPAVYRKIRGILLAGGVSTIGWIRPCTLSSDPVLRRRAQEIIHHLLCEEADAAFLHFCQTYGEDLNLEQGVWLLAATHYPEINRDAYTALLDSFAGELKERLENETSPALILEAINRYLFGELSFSGNQEQYYDPDNSYLNRVIDRRSGNPISLCVVYWLLAKRLQLPVVGIGMPGHFVCRYQSPTDSIYIDPFNRGRLLTRADCIKYLQQSSHGFHESFLSPVSSARALMRICSNLHQVYSHLNMREESARLQRYLVALVK